MRAILATIILALFSLAPVHARPGPDCVVVFDLSGPVCKSRPQVKGKFGVRTAKKKEGVTVAGRTFKPTPNVVSHHSDATAWIAEARRYRGMNAQQIGLSRRTLWCGTFMGRVADLTGLKKPRNPHWAADWGEVGHRISGPRPGAIALIQRGRRIGHVGIVTGIDGRGNPIIISGNHNNRVVETAYPRSRVVAYVWPG